MSTESPPQPRPRPRASRAETERSDGAPEGASWGLGLFDVLLIGLFLALAFLLGVFPLKDTDFYWHLRTGDLIRKTGAVPHVDFYTFTRDGTPWIDLHWIFQVCISWIYERGGVPALTLAKCLVTCAALLLLITARRPRWPVWTMILAWLPALLVLSGRMYVRPETLSLFYLSIYLAVLCRWDRRPWLAWLLPVVQVAWVNSHGLFVLGPIVLGFGLVDAALRSRGFHGVRKRWWTIVASASAAAGLACLANPYGIHGALFPLELASTMSNSIFSESIAELQTVPRFIEKAGLWVLPLQLHFATIALGALSFLIPIAAVAFARIRSVVRPRSNVEDDEPASKPRKKKGAERGDARAGAAGRKSRRKPAAAEAESPGRWSGDDAGWRISVLRLLLFAAFTLLSFKATRNSHQFAAVVGTVTAWNFAEWVGSRRPRKSAEGDGVRPRLAAMVALIVLLFVVGSGQFYAWTGEGRRIGWDEEPLWFPHEGARFAGGPGMPDRFLSYHNGLASVFLYHNSPERPGGPGKRVYTDPRLEVTGPELYQRYQELQKRINGEQPGWQEELDAVGRPSIMVDHEMNSQTGAVLMGSDRWRCVWFDAMVAVFIHDSYDEAVAAHHVDFGDRHFHPSPALEPQGAAALVAEARGLRNYVNFYGGRRAAGPMIWLGLDYARRVVQSTPDSLEGWKTIGLIEMFRAPLAQPSPRFRLAFDPIFDLSPIRATYALRRALAIAPGDFLTLLGLQNGYQDRMMFEPLAPVLDAIVSLRPLNLAQAQQQVQVEALRGEVRQRLGGPAATTWRNLGELDQMVEGLLARGRAESAAELLERAYGPGQAPWETVDRLSTLYLHLGDPARARAALNRATAPPRPAVRDARLAVCAFVEGRFAEARELYQQAIAQESDLFEARYGLAVLEQDDGRAGAAYEQALSAVDGAPSDVARASARSIASAVGRYAKDRDAERGAEAPR